MLEIVKLKVEKKYQEKQIKYWRKNKRQDLSLWVKKITKIRRWQPRVHIKITIKCPKIAKWDFNSSWGWKIKMVKVKKTIQP